MLYTQTRTSSPKSNRKGKNGMGEASPIVGVDAKASLHKVTAQTVREICDPSIAPGQERFVAPQLRPHC